jgi:60 kDa SS-A/Ro ribonucleoprotein
MKTSRVLHSIGEAVRHGPALRDAIDSSQAHSGTYLGAAVKAVEGSYDRLIIITDEQAHDQVPAPDGNGYMINVASYKNGIGYGKWAHIDGWSESVIEYIRELENAELN